MKVPKYQKMHALLIVIYAYINEHIKPNNFIWALYLS